MKKIFVSVLALAVILVIGVTLFHPAHHTAKRVTASHTTHRSQPTINDVRALTSYKVSANKAAVKRHERATEAVRALKRQHAAYANGDVVDPGCLGREETDVRCAYEEQNYAAKHYVPDHSQNPLVRPDAPAWTNHATSHDPNRHKATNCPAGQVPAGVTGACAPA